MPAMYRSAIWMPDGNVVLSATQPDTDSLMLFRVHKSLLARHSSFFADLFASPFVGDDSETYEGLRLIPMLDMADDVFGLLTAVYGSAYLLTVLPEDKYDEEETPLYEQPLYAIAEKYCFDGFMNRVKKHLYPRKHNYSV